MTNQSLTLYELEGQLMQCFQQVQELQEAGKEQELESALSALEEYLSQSVAKRDRCGQFITSLDTTVAGLESEIDRLQDRKKKILRAREAMAQYILTVMARIGTKRLEGQTFSFKDRLNPPSVVIIDPIALPAEYLRQPEPPPLVPDKKKIAEDVKAGKEVPGVQMVQSHRLIIE